MDPVIRTGSHVAYIRGGLAAASGYFLTVTDEKQNTLTHLRTWVHPAGMPCECSEEMHSRSCTNFAKVDYCNAEQERSFFPDSPTFVIGSQLVQQRWQLGFLYKSNGEQVYLNDAESSNIILI